MTFSKKTFHFKLNESAIEVNGAHSSESSASDSEGVVVNLHWRYLA